MNKPIIVNIIIGRKRIRLTASHITPIQSFPKCLLDSSLHRDAFAKSLDGNDRRDHYLKRLDDKAVWAREELHALISMNQKKSIDVCGLKGSYAGAFGIPQFLPTSYLKWAHSGKDKQQPNLFYMPHAIMSVANFLKEHGWRKDMTEEEKRTVIWNYNRSSAYVDTVLTIAGKVDQDNATK